MKNYYLIFLLIASILIIIKSKETFIGILSPSKKNMPYDLRCEPKIEKKNFLFRNSSINYYVRPKCLKTI